jgi:hypothetical protein
MTGQLTPGKAPAVASITDDLERIAIGMVGLTTRALAHAESDLELTFPQWRAILVVGAEIEGARIGEVAARVGGTLPQPVACSVGSSDATSSHSPRTTRTVGRRALG